MSEYTQVAAYHHRVPARPPVTTAFCRVLASQGEYYGYWFVPYADPLDMPHLSIGAYHSPMGAYLAACRYCYGPIPRDFAVGVPAVTGLECLYDIQYPV